MSRTGRRVVIVAGPVLLAVALLLWAANRGPARIDGAWELVSINGAAPVLAPDGQPLRLVGSGDEVVVDGGCNTIRLPITEEGGALFGQGVSTAMGCPGALGESEAEYVRLLADVQVADQGDDTLVLVGAGVRIVYTAAEDK